VIGICDYGMGNRRSVVKAFERVGAEVQMTDDLEVLERAGALVVPGVGAFPQAMDELRERRLDKLVQRRAAEGVPVLGICLGMQLLFESSEEHDGAEGLGLLPGTVRYLHAPKLPHIGWNLVSWERDSALNEGLGGPRAFYHVHSLAPQTDAVLGWGEYGERFATVVGRDNVFGVQFHPEKSSADGLALLANFTRLAA
jgi:imidazole glycerol-phosphate synthase subunit HisH